MANHNDNRPRYGATTTERVCLKCNKVFNSIGVANRICGRCNSENERQFSKDEHKQIYDKKGLGANY